MKGVSDSGNDLRREQRVTAQLEEVVVDTDRSTRSTFIQISVKACSTGVRASR